MKLRNHQQQSVCSIRDEIKKGYRKILLVLPTGGGKSHVMGEIAYLSIEKGHRVLALMHRRQLVSQLMQRFEDCGVQSSIIMSGEESSLDCSAQIATCQTYARRLKLDKIEDNPFFIDASIVFIDEAHHVLSDTYQEILSNYEDKTVIGVTATPVISSGTGMGEFFDTIVQPVQVNSLIEEGYLVRGEYYGPSSPDLSKLKTVVGDYEQKGLDKVMNQPQIIGDVVENWLHYASDLQTMVFAVNVNHSKALRNAFIKSGIRAEHLDAHAPDEEREDTLRRFKCGDIQTICNVGLYTEGTDIPEIQCIVLARPTKSLGLHLQMVGRGARSFKNKDKFLVVDHGGNISRLGFYEDEIIWSLDGKKAGSKKKVDRTKEKKIRTCEECSFLFTGKTCPHCGYEIKFYNKLIEAEAAELQLLKKTKKQKPTREEKKKFLQMAEYHRRFKKYKTHWSAWLYKEKFKVWPRGFGSVAPLEPDRAFRNYLTYRNIKYMKMRKKRFDKA